MAAAASPPRRPGFAAAGCALLVLAGGLAYHNSFTVPFVFDDGEAIARNASIRHLASALHPPAGGSTVTGRPLLNLSLAINYAWGGTAVGGYHAVNLAIHLLAGLTLFGIVRRTLEHLGGEGDRPRLLALAAALIWTLHPLQTEAVTYLVQRAESLMGLCYLLTLYCFIRGAEKPADSARPGGGTRVLRSRGGGGRRRFAVAWSSLSILSCLLGAGVKEVIVSAPVIVLLYDATFLSGGVRRALRQRGWYYAGLAASWVFLGSLVLGANERGGSAGFGIGVSWGRYLLTQFPAILHYLRLSLWPRPLVFDYGTQWVDRPLSILPAALAVVLLAAASGFALFRRGRVRALGFAGAWFFAILSVTSLVPGARQTMAEHRMYLALAPLVVVAVVAIDAAIRWAVERWRRLRGLTWPPGRQGQVGRAASALLLGLMAAGLGLLTTWRNDDYRSGFALWSDTVAKAPQNPWAHNELGYALLALGRTKEAEAEYETALRISPDHAEVHNNLAMELAKIPGRMPEAIAQYEEALRINPNFAQAHNNLASELAKIPGRTAEALQHYEEALRIDPNFAEAQNNLAMELAKIPGRMPEALAHYEAALRIRPDFAIAQNNIAVAYARSGRFDEAIVHFKLALKLDPTLTGARETLDKLQAMRR